MEILSDFLEGGGTLFIIISLFLLLWLAFDNWLHLSMEWRIIAFILLTLTLFPQIKKIRRKIYHTLKYDNLALRLEKNNDHHENKIVNALYFCRKSVSNLSPLEKEIITESSFLLSDFSLAHNLKRILKFRNILPLSDSNP